MTEETQAETTPQADAPPQISAEKIEALILSLKSQQSLSFAIVAAIISSLIGAAIWATLTVTTGYQIGWVAVGIGYLVGMSVRKFGKGMSTPFSVVGATFAFLGCIGGNFFSVVHFIGKEEHMSFGSVLQILDYSAVPSLMAATFSPMDLLFYGIAIYEGSKFSKRQITAEDFASLRD